MFIYYAFMWMLQILVAITIDPNGGSYYGFLDTEGSLTPSVLTPTFPFFTYLVKNYPSIRNVEKLFTIIN